jgi:hypothetical protein
MVKFSDIVVTDKKLGEGYEGVVFLAKDRKDSSKKYAYKIMRVLDKKVKQMGTEIKFYKEMGSKYPDHFLTLYDYRIQKDCKFHYTPKHFINKHQKKWFNDVQKKSKQCAEFLVPLVGDTLWKYLRYTCKGYVRSDKMFSIMIQYIYIAYLINKHNYIHYDLHDMNICIMPTKDKYINILGYKIPTYGIRLVAIDYPLVCHRYDKTNDKYTKADFKNNCNDIMAIAFLMLEYCYSLRNGNKLSSIIRKTLDKSVMNYTKTILPMIKCKHKDKRWIKGQGSRLASLYVKLMYPDVFIEHIHQKYKKFRNTHIPFNYVIPRDVIHYMIINLYNPKAVLLYAVEAFERLYKKNKK